MWGRAGSPSLAVGPLRAPLRCARGRPSKLAISLPLPRRPRTGFAGPPRPSRAAGFTVPIADSLARSPRRTEVVGLGEEVEVRLLGSTEVVGLGEEVEVRLLGSTEVVGLGEEVEVRLLGSTEVVGLGQDVGLRLVSESCGASGAPPSGSGGPEAEFLRATPTQRRPIPGREAGRAPPLAPTEHHRRLAPRTPPPLWSELEH